MDETLQVHNEEEDQAGADPKKTWKTEPEIERADLCYWILVGRTPSRPPSERRRDYLHVPKLYVPKLQLSGTCLPAGLM